MKLAPLFLLGGLLHAASWGKESLKGIDKIAVIVVPEEGCRSIMDSGRLKTDAEVKLRVAGIRLVDKNEATLQVYIGCAGGREGISYAVDVELTFSQPIAVMQDKFPSNFEHIGMTWQSGSMLLCRASACEKNIRKLLADASDEFVNDFLAVNPK